jgi:hypothetical protein
MRKAITNQDHRFIWSPQVPTTGTPSLAIDTESGISENFVRFTDDVSVTAIANDRRTLTVSSAPASYYRQYQNGFLLTSSDTYYSVNVSRFVGTTAILAEPLPREIDLSTSATLHLNTMYVDIDSTAIATSGVYPFRISYNELNMSNVRQERGLFKVTPRPFNTGLDHAQFVAMFANLADMIPRRQSDFSTQIKVAENEIILAVRDHLNSDDITEDEVFNPESFQLAHSYCSAAIVYEMNLNLDAASAMRARCQELIDSALRSISLDLDGDGVIDAGEEDLRRKGGNAQDFRASWRSYSKTANDSFFNPVRGMRH